MNNKIAYSVFIILSVLALTGNGTFAFFSDVGTSSNNTFATGSLNLQLTDGDESNADSVTASFGATLAPGGCTGPQTLSLQNAGTISAHHAEVALTNTVTDNADSADPDIDAFMKINTLTYEGADVSTQISDSNANGFKDLADWASNPNILDNLSLTDTSNYHDLVLDICLDGSAGNTVQGDSVQSVFTVLLNQDISQ